MDTVTCSDCSPLSYIGSAPRSRPEPPRQRERAALVRAGHHDAELVAAQSRRDVIAARVRRDHPAQVGQDHVANAVAVLVVDHLQAVQVQQNDRQRLPGDARLLDLHPRDFVEVAAVVEARQFVAVDQFWRSVN